MPAVINSQAVSWTKRRPAGFENIDRTDIIARIKRISMRKLVGHFELLMLQV
jgi:hypothetical protein